MSKCPSSTPALLRLRRPDKQVVRANRAPAKADAKKELERVEGYLAPPVEPAGGDGNLLDALEQMKPLIAQYGVDGVKRMAELLG